MSSIPFLSFLGEPKQSAYRELSEELPGVEFQNPSDWSVALESLTDGQIPLAAICGLLYKKLRAAGVPLQPIVSPVLNHPRYQKGPYYWADVIVRKDSPIKNFEGLKQKVWLFNEPSSYSGYYSYLSEVKNRDLGSDFLGERVKTGSHAESLRRLREGEGDFSVIDSTIWDFLTPDEQADFRVLSSLGPKPAPLLVCMPGFKNRVLELLDKATLPSLFKSFTKVQDSDYDVMEQDWNKGLQLVGQTPATPVFLRSPEASPDRPFSSLEQAKSDQAYLELNKKELFALLGTEPTKHMDNGGKFYLKKEGELERHTYVMNPEKLNSTNMAIVGFFSEMKSQEKLQALFEADEKVVNQFHKFPGMLIYYPREYATGRWGNFVIFENRRAQKEWADNRPHLDAIKDLAADSYDNVRLHVGVWTSKDEPLKWTATKYLHYSSDGLWRGVRCYRPLSE